MKKNLFSSKMALFALSLFLFLGVSLDARSSMGDLEFETQRTQGVSMDLSPGVFMGNFGVMANIVPTAGATETFTPDVGDHFFDPGGPGGSSTGGTPGNYPNCGCATVSTLAGVTEVNFLFFSVFANWDYLRIYDGVDTSGTKLYDNGAGGANEGDITLADMIASHGSSTFTSTTGNLTFYFHASAVVDYGGWDVEIVATDGGGGGTGTGETCETALVVSSLPYDHAGTTADYGNDYDFNDVPALAPGAITTGTGSPYYLDGNDVVYAYTPTQDEVLNISTTNDDDWIGLWAFTGCPFSSTVGYHTSISGATRMIEGLPVTAGTTYYFVISTWSPPESTNYTIHIEKVGGTGGSDVDCDQGDDSNNFENGYNITAGGSFRNADDFFVSVGNTLNVQQIELNVFGSEPIATMDFIFYEDNGSGAPSATIVETLSNVAVESVAIGSQFGYTIYAVFADVNLSFTEGAYWMQPVAHVGTAFWEISSLGTLGSYIHTSEANGPWIADVDMSHGVFKLHCEPVDPPEDQCLLGFDYVEAITRVIVSDIDNTSPASSTIEIEDFTSIEGHVAAGESYPIALEGNTEGNFTNFFTVWVDWDQNGTYDSTEMYEIGSITNSTGTDGQQATGTIAVPANAPEGNTTMRVIKNFNSSPTDPCGVYSFGQAEDYTIIVGEGSEPEDCTFEHTTTGDGNGGSGSSVDSEYKSAVDLVIPAGEVFTLHTIKVPFLTFAPEDAPITAEVVYYEDDNGFPGIEVGAETVVPTILSSGPWINPVAFVFETELTMTPYTFNGDSGSDKTYWVEISMGTATNQGTVFWLYTDGEGLEGQPLAQFNPTDGWATPEATREGVYSFSGQCDTLGVSDMTSFDFAYYPNPVKDVLNIKSEKAVKSVEAFNLTGQKVISNAKVLNGQINVNALTAGTYVFKVIMEDGQVETFKIIKK